MFKVTTLLTEVNGLTPINLFSACEFHQTTYKSFAFIFLFLFSISNSYSQNTESSILEKSEFVQELQKKPVTYRATSTAKEANKAIKSNASKATSKDHNTGIDLNLKPDTYHKPTVGSESTLHNKFNSKKDSRESLQVQDFTNTQTISKESMYEGRNSNSKMSGEDNLKKSGLKKPRTIYKESTYPTSKVSFSKQDTEKATGTINRTLKKGDSFKLQTPQSLLYDSNPNSKVHINNAIEKSEAKSYEDKLFHKIEFNSGQQKFDKLNRSNQ